MNLQFFSNISSSIDSSVPVLREDIGGSGLCKRRCPSVRKCPRTGPRLPPPQRPDGSPGQSPVLPPRP